MKKKKLLVRLGTMVLGSMMITACSNGEKTSSSVKDQTADANEESNNLQTMDKEDTISPVISGTKNRKTVEGKKINLLKGVAATDDIDGDLTDSIKVSGADFDKVGTQTIKYTVTDSSGNKTVKKITLTIEAESDDVENEEETESESNTSEKTEKATNTAGSTSSVSSTATPVQAEESEVEHEDADENESHESEEAEHEEDKSHEAEEKDHEDEQDDEDEQDEVDHEDGQQEIDEEDHEDEQDDEDEEDEEDHEDEQDAVTGATP